MHMINLKVMSNSERSAKAFDRVILIIAQILFISLTVLTKIKESIVESPVEYIPVLQLIPIL